MRKHQYRITERKRHSRLKQIAQGDHDLRGELALARLLAEEALAAGNIGQCASLLEVARRLSVDDTERALREKDLMRRDEAIRLAHRMGSEMVEILRDRLPEEQVHDIMDEWCIRVKTLAIEDQR